jgi:hypothetical protein
MGSATKRDALTFVFKDRTMVFAAVAVGECRGGALFATP